MTHNNSLRISNANSDKPIAIFNWFALHPNTMNSTNGLVDGDNKGFASDMIEKDFGSHFVAGFGSTNLGDVSPNLDDARCHYNGDDDLGNEGPGFKFFVSYNLNRPIIRLKKRNVENEFYCNISLWGNDYTRL